MNNSFIASQNLELEKRADTAPLLRQRETELLAILEAMKNINNSKFWKLLVDKIFKPDFEKLGDKLRKEKNPTEMYRLQGRLNELDKITNFDKEYELYFNELQNIRSKLTNAEDNREDR